MKERTYIAIDLKSFYASVECIQRDLDPMTTNLVVADAGRTEKTIGLAVSPSLKSFGIGGRPRLFEVVQRIREVNAERRRLAGGKLEGSSCRIDELRQNPRLAVDYIVAPPQMAFYMEFSARIYQVYLQFIAPEDIHVYSIDEVFIDATDYLKTYGVTAEELTERMVSAVYRETGITATAGIGSNLYLCKVAMDIVAKHMPANRHGMRVASLNEESYRRALWSHRPLTDFWRVGQGIAKRLEAVGIYTMGDIARCSVGDPNSYYNEELLYKLFGVNAELLIDHAWGWEPCRISDIKAYRPASNSICSGQVLQQPYSCEKARLVVREMTDLLVLDLVEKGLVTDQLVLTVGYDVENLTAETGREAYTGEVTVDRYGRAIPKHAHGTENLKAHSSSTREIMEAVCRLYDRIINPKLTVRRITLSACRVMNREQAAQARPYEQLDIFSSVEEQDEQKEKERIIQETVLDIRKKYGKNAILKGMNLEEGATAKDRNRQIGGHKA
ncbi:MAG: DNA methylase [Ruminococcaceae bacterium]|nr:DNA methylase [Oscillospiraceae bacterium]